MSTNSRCMWRVKTGAFTRFLRPTTAVGAARLRSQGAHGRPVHIAALARNHRQRDLFFIDANGQLCTTFMVRTQPLLGTREPWSTFIALSRPDMFEPGATLAVAHGAGNSEHLFAVGRDHQVYWTHEDDNSAWSAPVSIGTTPASPTGSIVAVRRTVRDVVVAFVGLDGLVHTRQLDGDRWSASPDVIPQLGPPSPHMKIAMSLRDSNQLDVFGVAADGDNRLWTSGDGAGTVYLRAVFPKLVFSHASLVGAKGMVPMEIGGSGSFPEQVDCLKNNDTCQVVHKVHCIPRTPGRFLGSANFDQLTAVALARAANLWTTLWLAQVNRRAYAGSSGSLRTAIERAAYRSGF